jgi:hypothetical protein
MRHVLWLPLTTAKCIGVACKYPGNCATRDIPADRGRPLTDHSLSAGIYMSAPCSAPNWLKRISYESAVKPADKPVIREWIGR